MLERKAETTEAGWDSCALVSLPVILLLVRSSVEDHALIARAAAGCPKNPAIMSAIVGLLGYGQSRAANTARLQEDQ
jgi:hypothetical protein